MADYVGKEQVIEWFRPYGHEDEGIPYYGLVTDIREMKPADVVPVVRCKDCTHLYGTLCTVCGLLPRKPDDFCSCGERKDGTDSDTDGSI